MSTESAAAPAADPAPITRLAPDEDAEAVLRLTREAFRHLLARSPKAAPRRIPGPGEVRRAGYVGGWLNFRLDLIRLRRTTLFDRAYYMAHNPDLAFGTLAPEAHFLLFGGHEGRNPGPAFDSTFYLRSSPDVAAAGHNPLIHYLRHGWKQGRRPHPDLGPAGQRPADRARPGSDEPAPVKPRSRRFFDHLQFSVRWPRVPLSPPPGEANPDSLDIHWVIPDFNPGAGGHMTIFRMVRFLESFGHRQTLWIFSPTVHKTPAAALETINRHFQPTRPTVRFLPDGGLDGISGDAVIATDRWTAFAVAGMAHFRRRFYFVQDHECEFYPAGTEFLLAQRTYAFGFDCLCAGEWLHDLMRHRYGLWAMTWHLAYDRSIYHPPAAPRLEVPGQPPRIAFYARLSTPRRAAELGILALEELARRGVPFEVDLFGGKLPHMDLHFPHTSHGVLSGAQLGDLYRQATVGMVFSATNHSLIPREMMACGLPVVELDTPNVTAVFPREAIELAEPHPIGIADALAALLADPQRRQARTAAGLAHVAAFDWEASARLVDAALRARVATGAS